MISAASKAEERGGYSRLECAIGLLPAAEKIAPGRIDHYLWTALSLRGAEAWGAGRWQLLNSKRTADPVLGALVARYDREQARLLTLTPGNDSLSLAYSDSPYFLLGGLATFDPESAVRFTIDLPEDSASEVVVKARAWNEVLTTLGKSVKDGWEAILGEQYLPWLPDEDEWSL